jgi:uncharacterized protein YigE (DUF2233 family)
VKNLRLLPASLLLVLLMVPVAPAYAQTRAKAKIGATLTVADSGAWKPIQRGLEHRNVALERSEPNYTLELKLLRFDSRLFVPRVIRAADLLLKAATAKSFAEKFRAVAAINANYFDTQGRPLAYLKTATKEINPNVSKHALYTGVFGVRDSAPFVVHRDDFQPAEATAALQSGPLLLHRGTAVEAMPGLGRYARRAVIGIDTESRMIVAVTEAVIGGLSFPELQELFGDPRWQIRTPDLLNLDGGGSAQLYVKAGKFEDWLPGTVEIPVAIGFFLKSP